MKKMISRSLAVFLLLAFFCSISVSASASVDASDYLQRYNATISAQGGGVIKISYTVIATDTLDVLGVSKIVVEKKDGGSWTPVKTYTNIDYPELSGTNDYVFKDHIFYDGVAGTVYRAEVTIFGNTDYRTFYTSEKRAT